MAEKQLVLDGMELHYKGLFDLNKLLARIDKYSADKGYAKSEKRRDEKVTPTGKEFSIELRHTKAKTQYFVLMIKMRIHITDLKEVEVEKDKQKEILNEGKIDIIFDGWTTTDLEGRWEQKPIYYFFVSLWERVGHKIKMDKFYGEIVADIHHIHDNIEAYLELHKF